MKDIVPMFINAIDGGTKKAYQMYWYILISFLSQYWLLVTTILVMLFVVALVNALAGRWGMLGSVLYNYLYFGILFIVGLIWGSDIFVSNFFSVVCTILLYPVCYILTGIILTKTGLRRRY